MDYQFHQTVIFMLMTVYVPLIMTQIIYMIKEKGWSSRLCYGVITASLIVNLPNIIKNYQQYLMGHFSGLPEIISKNQLIADTIVVVVFTLVVIACAYVEIVIRGTSYNDIHKKNLLEY